MAATAFRQTIGNFQPHGYFDNRSLHQECGNASVRLVSKCFKVDVGLLKRGDYCSRKRSFCVVPASSAQTTVFNPVSSLSKNTTNNPIKKSNEAAMILIRHGESVE